MKGSNSFKRIGASTLISMIIMTGIVACSKQGSTGATESNSPPALDQHSKDLITQIKAKARNADVTGGSWSPGDGVQIAPNVEFVYFTNRFGETKWCQVSFSGVNAKDGSKTIPKWSMDVDTMPSNKSQFVFSESFFGPKNSIRVIFDDDTTSQLELNEPVADFMSLTLSDKVKDRFMQAKKVTLNHGMAGMDKIEYQFDVSSFPLAVQLSNALCPM
jgi:hypothetical protein